MGHRFVGHLMSRWQAAQRTTKQSGSPRKPIRQGRPRMPATLWSVGNRWRAGGQSVDRLWTGCGQSVDSRWTVGGKLVDSLRTAVSTVHSVGPWELRANWTYRVAYQMVAHLVSSRERQQATLSDWSSDIASLSCRTSKI